MLVKNDKEFQRVVCERDNYTCQVSGKSYNYECYFNEKGINQYVCAHHIKSKKAFPELRLETDNGICVDRENHNNLHNGTKIYENTN